MKRKGLSLVMIIFFLSFFTSCVTNYYTMYTTEDAVVFRNSKESTITKVIIPKGSSIYVTKGNSERSKVKWNNYYGWIRNSSYSHYKPDNLVSAVSLDSSYTSPGSKVSNYPSGSASGGTVQVKGYYRKNGTYVKPHTRSAPRRR